jgi:hypothetical protein
MAAQLGRRGKNMNVSYDGPGAGHRDYRLLVSARGDLDLRFAKLQRALCTKWRLWGLLQREDLTEENLRFACCMAARIGGIHERLLAEPHLLFLIVEQPQVPAELKAMRRCMKDPFTADFLDEWDIETQDARMVLVLILLVGTVPVETLACMGAAARYQALLSDAPHEHTGCWRAHRGASFGRDVERAPCMA